MTAGSSGVEVEAIDPGDTAAFDAWFAVWNVIDHERYPDGPGWQYEELLAMARDRESAHERRPLVARRAGVVVGVVGLEMTRHENFHLARVDVRVLPEQRRRGVGTALVEASERIAAAAGRTELAAEGETPERPDYVDGATPFAQHLGFRPVQRMVRRTIGLPLDTGHAEALQKDPRATAAGYTLVTFGNHWPDEHLDDRCELGRRMSTDAPMGEQELDEEIWDAARVRALEASITAQNRAKVATAARHDASGRFVGFTEVAIPLGAPESAWQHDTLVMREHRGHGLGFAMKLANLSAVQEQHTGVRRINTWNAEDNAPMITVNADLGFRVEAHSTDWHRPIAPPQGSA
ncbi:MAG TPA: GNAT family N-acetyltransferase [Acidimicrobiales bacterium]|nr:GNAT family N-acetyltransferase [Acidimicrobiales bacterium]